MNTTIDRRHALAALGGAVAGLSLTPGVAWAAPPAEYFLVRLLSLQGLAIAGRAVDLRVWLVETDEAGKERVRRLGWLLPKGVIGRLPAVLARGPTLLEIVEETPTVLIFRTSATMASIPVSAELIGKGVQRKKSERDVMTREKQLTKQSWEVTYEVSAPPPPCGMFWVRSVSVRPALLERDNLWLGIDGRRLGSMRGDSMARSSASDLLTPGGVPISRAALISIGIETGLSPERPQLSQPALLGPVTVPVDLKAKGLKKLALRGRGPALGVAVDLEYEFTA